MWGQINHLYNWMLWCQSIVSHLFRVQQTSKSHETQVPYKLIVWNSKQLAKLLQRLNARCFAWEPLWFVDGVRGICHKHWLWLINFVIDTCCHLWRVFLPLCILLIAFQMCPAVGLAIYLGSWIPCNLWFRYILFHEKTHFLILAVKALIIFGKMNFMLISEN